MNAAIHAATLAAIHAAIHAENMMTAADYNKTAVNGVFFSKTHHFNYYFLKFIKN